MCNKQKNFSLLWNRVRNFLVENFVFCESKKFLSQGVCTLKFLFLRDCRDMNGLSYTTIRKILAGSGRVVEIF